MKVNKKLILLVASLSLIATITSFTYYTSQTERDVNKINKHINLEKIKFGMSEQEVIQRWGNGVSREGFGGYGRDYNNKRVELSFSDDEDNDLYGTVSGIRISNQSYSIFGIHPGTLISESSDILRDKGFKSNGNLFIKGEFTISLYGESRVAEIHIWFNDKDLRDRHY